MRLTKERVRRLAIWTAMFAVLGTDGVSAGDNVWTNVGPEGGGIQALAVDPQNPGTVYASTQFNVYRSTDGAGSWANTGFTGHANALAVDPRNRDTIYAPTPTGVSKSTDAGASWNAASSGLPDGWPIVQLIIDPQNSSTLYALTMIAGPHTLPPAAPMMFVPTVFKTTDGGATWNPASSGLAPGNYALTLALDPLNPSILYAGGASGPFPPEAGGALFKSTDGGASWNTSGEGITNCCVSALAVDPQDSKIVYAAWTQTAGVGGLLKSRDGGTTWTDLGSDLPGAWASTLAIDPQNQATLYSLTSTGFFKSTNGGVNWNPANLAGQVRTFAIDPQNPATVYAAAVPSSGVNVSGSGVFKTTDGGTSWNAASSGIRALPIGNIAIDPQHAGTLYAAAGNVFKSTDGGAHWTLGDIAVRKLAIDPRDPGTVFALVNDDTSGQPAKSTDSGTSWSRLNVPLASGDFVTDLAIDPRDSSVVYVGTGAEGILKSRDGGASWNPANAGLQKEGINILAISGPKQTTVYASTFIDCDCSSLLGDGMFKSTDGGSSWTAANSGLPGGSVVQGQGRSAFSIAVDPQDPSTLYIGLSWNDTYSSGLFKSVDGGASWKQLSIGLPEGTGFGPIVINPLERGTVYLGTDAGVLQSTDGGASWKQLSIGLPTISSLAVDPQDPNRLYAGTAGGLFVITFPAGRRTIRR